jgi:serine/threonine-protein kinase
MGHVYRAVNVEIERAVAIKVLRSEHATNQAIVDRFLREARAANLVRHPNVVDVVDIGRHSDGSPFIVQELLEGEDLSRYIEKRSGKLTLEEVEEYLLPVVEAVAEAHAQGVVHRDIKPENVFLAEQGRRRIPKLLDFGISKVRLPNIKATEVGVMMGTPAYMAPEQVRGSRDADPRSDVWALGIMLFEVLAGRMPFEAADAPALFVAIATKDVPRLVEVNPDINPKVSTIVERCLRRSPDERYLTALELARDLRHVLAGDDIEPTQKRSVPPARLGNKGGPPPRLADMVPDLALPPPKAMAATALDGRKKPAPATEVPETAPGHSASLALGKTEFVKPGTAPALPPPARASSPDLPPARASSPDFAPGVAPAPAASSGRLPAPASSGRMPAPPSSGSPGSAGRLTPDQALPGVMLAGASTPSHRRPMASSYLPETQQQTPGPDVSMLVGLAVVGLTSIGVTAVLMTVAYQPEGWPLVGSVMNPVPAMLHLVVQGGLALGGLVAAGRFAMSGVKKWRGDVMGGRGAAVFNAVVAGAIFFAALQLARAAW